MHPRPSPPRSLLALPLLWIALAPVLMASARAEVRPLELLLPTPNRALFDGDLPRFYMYTDRTFEGRTTKPWQGGKFGYSRNPKRTSEGVVFTRFHEGVDIRPVERDSAGRPLDIVRAISAGRVAYVNNAASASNYGRYVVVEHDWGYGKFYSLYAHLGSVRCEVGQAVRPGSSLGVLGYTGAGIDRTRAHLHLELNLMLSTRFTEWHDGVYGTANKHGAFNGLNLAGIDIAGLYLRHRDDPDITLPQFIARMRPYFRVVVANRGVPDIVRFYPWLARNMADAEGAPSWQITLSSSGVPLEVAPSQQEVDAPAVSWVTRSPVAHSLNTRSLLTGSGDAARLSTRGRQYVELLTGAF